MDAEALRAAFEAAGLSTEPVWLPEVGSTQDVATALARDGAVHGTTVVAERQTGGRGRRGRTWVNTPGTVAFSVVLRPTLPARHLGLVPLAAAVGMREALGEVLHIKWPNDLLLPDGRKVAGVLAEAEVTAGQVGHVVLGVGVNVSGAPDLPVAASLAELGKRPPDAAWVVAHGVARILHWLGQPLHVVREAWEDGAAHLGQTIEVAGRTGMCLGLAEDGGLRLRLDDGTEDVVHTGDVQLVSTHPGGS